MDYDYIIIGSGPCGLTMALYLSDIGKKCLIIDKNKDIGGCHRVTRVDEKFTEHGPRIYLSSYKNVHTILEKLGSNWDSIFTRSKFSVNVIQSQTTDSLSFREKSLIAFEFIKMVLGFNLSYTSVEYFANKHNFSESSKDYMNRICRLTDGAGSDRYTMKDFLNLFNQNFFYNTYQPREANDKLLFKLWRDKLKKNNVDFILDTEVLSIKDNIVYLSGNQSMSANKIVACIPPSHFVKLCKNSFVQDKNFYKLLSTNFDLETWSKENSYINDIPVTFHWKEYDKNKLPKVWGFPKSDWGVAFIVLSDYFNPEADSSLVISTCATIQNQKSDVTGKSVHESNPDEFVNEMFRQLKLSFPDIPLYDEAIIHPSVKRIDGNWVEDDSAYVETTKQAFISFENKNIPNFYYVGTQNGNSYYRFTSMESAVTNAMFAVSNMENLNINIKKPLTISKVIIIFFLSILIIIFCILLYKSRNRD